MKRINYFKPLVTIAAVFALLTGACEKETFEETKKLNDFSFKSAHTTSYPLYAGQHIYVGELEISIDGDNNLWATFYSSGTCDFTEFALFVGELYDVPLSGGNTPRPGHFPYKNETGVFGPVSLDGLSDDYVILAHAVCGEETIWGQPICVDNYDDYSFTNIFGTPRWGWVIKPGDDECVEETILTAKIQVKNKLTYESVFGVVSTGTPYYLFTSGWCDYMSVVGTDGVNTYDIIAPGFAGSVKIADMIVENTGSNLNITIVTDIPDNIIEWSYVFVGSESELEALTTECPDYLNFPYSETTGSTQHVYSIPLN